MTAIDTDVSSLLLLLILSVAGVTLGQTVPKGHVSLRLSSEWLPGSVRPAASHQRPTQISRVQSARTSVSVRGTNSLPGLLNGASLGGDTSIPGRQRASISLLNGGGLPGLGRSSISLRFPNQRNPNVLRRGSFVGGAGSHGNPITVLRTGGGGARLVNAAEGIPAGRARTRTVASRGRTQGLPQWISIANLISLLAGGGRGRISQGTTGRFAGGGANVRLSGRTGGGFQGRLATGRGVNTINRNNGQNVINGRNPLLNLLGIRTTGRQQQQVPVRNNNQNQVFTIGQSNTGALTINGVPVGNGQQTLGGGVMGGMGNSRNVNQQGNGRGMGMQQADSETEHDVEEEPPMNRGIQIMGPNGNSIFLDSNIMGGGLKFGGGATQTGGPTNIVIGGGGGGAGVGTNNMGGPSVGFQGIQVVQQGQARQTAQSTQQGPPGFQISAAPQQIGNGNAGGKSQGGVSAGTRPSTSGAAKGGNTPFTISGGKIGQTITLGSGGKNGTKIRVAGSDHLQMPGNATLIINPSG